MTHRKFTGDKLVIASHNSGKVREIGDLLAPFGVEVTSVARLNLPEPVEDGNSFIENARIKSLAAARASGLPALSDDSGLVVRALGGRPGIYTANWAEQADGSRDFHKAMERVERALNGAKDRSAAFTCALSLAWPDGHTEDFMGRAEGTLVWPLRGVQGFGFDPMFQPRGHALTFAEMDQSEKHRISHRADAFKQLVDACFDPV